MADFSKFRSSLGGFNRGDVATYIETLCRTHGAELKERDGRIESLTAALAEAQGQREEAIAQAEALRRQVEELETQLEAATAPPPEEEEALSEDAADETEVPDYPTLELEAYRRAEATERLASQRAQQLKRELVDFLENTTARYQQTGEDIAALAEDLKSGLKRLEENLSELDLLFGETAEHLETLTPAEPLEVE